MNKLIHQDMPSGEDEKNMKIRQPQDNGFTLIEIMVSMVISSLVIAGIYGVYTIQQRSYKTQEQVTELQQKLRSAVDFVTSDIRMAGYNPGKNCGMNPKVMITALPKEFTFEYCDQDSNLNTISYYLSNGELKRDKGQAVTLAEGIDGIEFLYLNGDAVQTSVISEIRIVRLSLLIRSIYPDPHHTDTTRYLPASGDGTWSGLFASNPANDHFHRRLLITSIELRNVGL